MIGISGCMFSFVYRSCRRADLGSGESHVHNPPHRVFFFKKLNGHVQDVSDCIFYDIIYAVQHGGFYATDE